MFDSPSLLQITLLELVALFSLQTQTRIAQGRVHFTFHALSIKLLPFAHDFAFFRTHLHPAFRVTSKCLSIFRGHRHPAVTRIVLIRNVSWRGKVTAMSALRLRVSDL